MQKKNLQTIYICLDDSGKLSKKEPFCVYGGLVFFSKQERDKFIVQYRKIISNFKCKYCLQEMCSCNKKCPELKSNNIKPSNRRWIMNYIKKYFAIATVIDNNRVYHHIINNTASKGRYVDYCIRRLVKDTIKKLIETKQIDPCKPLKIILEIDEQSTKSNGYYGLKEGIIEELIHGIMNFNYSGVVEPLLKSNLVLELGYRDSKKCIVIQAADFIAGTVRKAMIQNTKECKPCQQISFLDYESILP